MPKSNTLGTVRLAVFLGLSMTASPVFAVDIISGNPATQLANSSTGTAGLASYNQIFDGVNLSGVVEVSSVIGGATYGCSGSLLDNGTSILTAGHCLESTSGVLASSVTVSFYGPSGLIAESVSSFQVDPGFNGSNSTTGADLAVLTLSQPAPSFAVEYSLYTGPIPLATPLTIAGYGIGGTGTTGGCGNTVDPSTCGSNSYNYGELRVGTNEYEGTGAILGYSSNLLVGQFYEPGTGNCTANTRSPEYDPNTTDALCVTHPYAASDEVGITPGDSGGPSFYDGEIVGVHDLGICLSATDNGPCTEPPSVGATDDSYFGQVFADTSVAGNITFIDDADGLPEPGTATLFICALIAAAGLRLRGVWPCDWSFYILRLRQ